MPKKQPNVVIFFTDQQRWDSSSLYGNPLDLTLNYDRFAQEGTHCSTAYTCQPVCMPARASLQTGQFASVVGSPTNAHPLSKEYKRLGNWFQEAGYRTGYVGKWHLSGTEPVPEEERSGYDYWLGANTLEFSSDSYNTYLYDNDGKETFLPGYRVDAMTDAGIRYMHENRDEPFFLMMSFLEPHHQNCRDEYAAPAGYAERYHSRWTPPDVAGGDGSAAWHLGGYWGCIKRLDEAFGRVLDALRSMDLLDDTIVLYTADHGSHFKTRNSEYKRSCHDGCTRIPMALSGGCFAGGGRIRQPLSLVDMPATLLDAAGIQVPDSMQGKSIVPLIGGRTDERPKEAFIQISESHCGRAIRTERWKFSVKATDAKGQDTQGSHYVEEFLYDMKADPYEQNNLAGIEKLAEIRQELVGRLRDWIKRIEGQEPVIDLLESHSGGQLYGTTLGYSPRVYR